MGIKGIYKEIGPGKRISLSKLSVDHLEQHGRPFRLAIDFSIWQYQTQAAKGGTNPAIRTLFYRIVRLIGLGIQPLFVFDGPNKPVFKRNKRSGKGDGVASAMAKRLIRLFGLPVHDAPGEAEAECALLQQRGIVDAVLSEDVDTIMFGCTSTLRNWSSNSVRGGNTPTHVSLYDTADLRQGESGLDRQGMVLVALMSGGDYIPEGVPGCGVKVACEAAKAGFGKTLCSLKRSDARGLSAWKESLLHELRTNDGGHFRTKHKALTIPEDFPDMDVLGYYTHPVVSAVESLGALEAKMLRNQDVDMPGMREFAAETFDWTFKAGAVKLIRVLAPSMLVRDLIKCVQTVRATATSGMEDMIGTISKTRLHDSTDGTPELRVAFVPNDIVKLDLDIEVDEPAATSARSGLALNSDDEDEGTIEAVQAAAEGLAKVYDPLVADLVWVPTTILKLSVPSKVEMFEEAQRVKVVAKSASSPKKPRMKSSDMPAGSIDKFFTVSKPKSSTRLPVPAFVMSSQSNSTSSSSLQHVRLKSTTTITGAPKTKTPSTMAVPKSKPSSSSSSLSQRPSTKPITSQASAPTKLKLNPWTITSSQVPTTTRATLKSIGHSNSEPILLSSSPVAPASPSSPERMNRTLQGLSKHNTPTKPRTHTPPAPPKRSGLKRAQTGPLQRGSTPALDAPQLRIPDMRSFAKVSRPFVTAKSLPMSKPYEHDLLEEDSDADSDLEDLLDLGTSTKGRIPSTGKIPAMDPKGRQAGPFDADDDDDDLPLTTTKTAATTKIYIPRRSDAGMCGHVELDREEADKLRNDPAALARRLGVDASRVGRAWRESDVSMVDLTGEV